MSRADVGWAAAIIGELIDVQTFRMLLPQPFDPWAEEFTHADETHTIIISRAWAGLGRAEDVHGDATRIVARLNGGNHLLHHDAKPVEVGRLFKFDDQGQSVPFTLLLGSQITAYATSRGRAFSAVSPAQPPTESKLQQWLRESDADDVKADLLAHVLRADNWYDIYKCMELGGRIVGSDRKLKARLESDWRTWDKVRRTANHYRHAPSPKHSLPPHAPSLEEARVFTLKALSSLL